MKPHLLTESASSAIPAITCKVSRKQLRERAVELAALDGRDPQDAGKSDWETAKQELMGESEHEAEAPCDNAAQSARNPDEEVREVSAPTPGWLT